MKKLFLTTIIGIFNLLSFGQGQEGGSDNFTLSLIPGAYQGKIIRCVNSDGDFIWMFLKTIPLDSLNLS